MVDGGVMRIWTVVTCECGNRWILPDTGGATFRTPATAGHRKTFEVKRA